jgi:hypothetical protein
VPGVADHQSDSGEPPRSWEPLRSELGADVRRVADRLGGMSQGQLTAALSPPERGFPPYAGKAHAGRAVATDLGHAARCLEAAAAGRPVPEWRPVPQLSDFAAGDQVAVTGHDLLAALDLVAPDAEVWFGELDRAPAVVGVERTARLLADLRRRL